MVGEHQLYMVVKQHTLYGSSLPYMLGKQHTIYGR